MSCGKHDCKCDQDSKSKDKYIGIKTFIAYIIILTFPLSIWKMMELFEKFIR